MDATATFLEEYKAAVSGRAEKASIPLARAGCDLVRELKRDGLRPEQVLALVKSHLANAGGNRFETKSLNDDVIAHCIEEYYMPTVPLHLRT